MFLTVFRTPEKPQNTKNLGNPQGCVTVKILLSQ